MIADDGTAIVMDFGSAIPARIKIETRSQALLQQVCFSFSDETTNSDAFL